MRCMMCDRPLSEATITIQKRGAPAHYGPVCARKAFPELYRKRSKRVQVPATKTEDEAQLELELAE